MVNWGGTILLFSSELQRSSVDFVCRMGTFGRLFNPVDCLEDVDDKRWLFGDETTVDDCVDEFPLIW